MPSYSEELKAAVLKKLLPPQNRSVVQVAAEEGISDVTLYSWSKHCRQQGVPVPSYRNHGDDGSPEAKLAVVIETASMSEAEPELSAYCRQKGLYSEQGGAALYTVRVYKKGKRKPLRNSSVMPVRPSKS